jgi:hypothetical protein
MTTFVTHVQAPTPAKDFFFPSIFFPKNSLVTTVPGSVWTDLFATQQREPVKPARTSALQRVKLSKPFRNHLRFMLTITITIFHVHDMLAKIHVNFFFTFAGAGSVAVRTIKRQRFLTTAIAFPFSCRVVPTLHLDPFLCRVVPFI